MNQNSGYFSIENQVPNWLTIKEAVKISDRLASIKITSADIYRNALSGNIFLSIYFQSPFILRKVKTSNHKVKLRTVENSLINRLCFLEKNCFINKRRLTVSTMGKYISPAQSIMDTTLAGYEYVLVQRLLARSLNIPLPATGAHDINYGISVMLSGKIFQVYEKVTWQERIKHQIMRLPENITRDIYENIEFQRMNKYYHGGHYFPVHNLPQDACFVIRYTEFEKLINMPIKSRVIPASSTRISTPLSRLFWLACKHNEAISPLIRQPYKLLSIFEHWASNDGVTDHLSGDTLKTALERGSPTSVSASN
ncbi:hypothetical protein Bresa_03238|uniref:Uncharacterized protein n=1 Tax=Brenneria salicis ATCC 15712 = DSM 30166 TaxID=714314 RepID=A0A366I0X6_9GAMM|nr:hypothetical protein [Brenneria salicis]NMN92887.1 hypothetical protein [Brenneria salicis ATCC 15712 = DSM 30166]RBP60996.1 hypothetical protein DES54_12848 [Brenneria salicis ATCC 15712 = DSM 30166]RLM29741.1 hypothetical protein BHG07_14375 [Brenneria salicis ATCC 15712 = DSM 30166]